MPPAPMAARASTHRGAFTQVALTEGVQTICEGTLELTSEARLSLRERSSRSTLKGLFLNLRLIHRLNLARGILFSTICSSTWDMFKLILRLLTQLWWGSSNGGKYFSLILKILKLNPLNLRLLRLIPLNLKHLNLNLCLNLNLLNLKLCLNFNLVLMVPLLRLRRMSLSTWDFSRRRWTTSTSLSKAASRRSPLLAFSTSWTSAWVLLVGTEIESKEIMNRGIHAIWSNFLLSNSAWASLLKWMEMQVCL